jgi:phosphomannomutase
MSSVEEVLAAARDYVRWDPDAVTAAAVQALIDANDVAKLTPMLTKRIQFGTAGLRAAMGPGYDKMNDLVILQTSQGLVRYLETQVVNAKEKGLAIGYDHRRLGSISSRRLAETTATVFLAAGFKVYFMENFVATPYVPFAIQHFKCAAGIMVTASHNPKADNGYKVYWENGAQIIPPHDGGIAHSINQNLQPWQPFDFDNVRAHSLFRDVTEEVSAEYTAAISRMSTRSSRNPDCSLRIAYTAMHGVGAPWIARAFEAFHHKPLHVVPQQRDPDPEFPTVVFPNPEEKGALNLAMQFAGENDCSVIIANDPDADRLAVAERLPDGSFKAFSGNEIGILLGYWLIQQWKEKGVDEPAAVLASVVSSRMLKKIATTERMQYHDTLTGFKWLGNRAQELRSQGVNVLFSYEEALGYCCGNVLCDKDGIAAGSIFVEMVGALAEGWHAGSSTPGAPRTVAQLFSDLGQQYGEFVSYNSYIVCHDPKLTDSIFHRLRHQDIGGGYWTEVAGQRIVSIQDITMGYDSSASDHVCSMSRTPDSHMIMYEFSNGVTITLRTSGTEPKIKYYTEIAGQPGQTREELKHILVSFVDTAVNEMLEPDRHGLKRA